MARAADLKNAAFTAKIGYAHGDLRWANLSARRSANSALGGHDRHEIISSQAWLVFDVERSVFACSEI